MAYIPINTPVSLLPAVAAAMVPTMANDPGRESYIRGGWNLRDAATDGGDSQPASARRSTCSAAATSTITGARRPPAIRRQ